MKKHIFSIVIVSSLALLPGASIYAQTPACVINSLSVSPDPINTGESATIKIKTSNCDKVILFGLNPNNASEGLSVQTNGSISSGALTASKTFTLEASKGSSKFTKGVTVNVSPEVATTQKKGFFARIASVVGNMVANVISAIF